MGTTRNHFLFFALVLISNFSFGESRGSGNIGQQPSGQVKSSNLSGGVAAGTAADVKLTGKNEQALTVGGASGWTKQDSTPAGKPCRVQLSELRFVDQQFPGPAVCVDADTDREAAGQCNGAVFVNPANPVYGKSDRFTGTPKAAFNPEGYYYCMSNRTENTKAHLCQVVALAANRASGLNLNFDFQESGEYGDGACVCTNGSVTANCNAGTEQVAAAGAQCAGPELAAVTAQRADDAPGRMCRCVRGTGIYPVATASARCAEEVRLANDPNAAAATAAAGRLDPALDECLSAWVQTAESCKAKADQAKTKCDEANSKNKPSNAAANITGSLGNVYSAANQGSGSRAECFRAGVMANTGQQVVRSMQATCEADFENCNTACGADRVEEFKRDCAQRTNKTFDQLLTDNAQGTPTGDTLRSRVAAIETNFTEGREVCTVQAQEKRSTLSNLLSGIGRALQSSVQCVCRLSSAGGNCAEIPSVQSCSQIPQPAGCGAYGAMNTCTPGSAGYDAKTCGCMQNPAQPGCSGSSNAISSFAGPGRANNLARGAAGGGANFGAGGGAPSGSRFDLGGNVDVENNDLSFLNGAKPGGSGAPNNSVGGGGAAGPGGAPNGNAAANEDKGLPPEDEKGVGGLFNSARSFMSNALGIGKKPVTTPTGNGALGKPPDMGKFKPNIRGIASRTSGMGSPNMDIWKMMSLCSSGNTCKSNENNYLADP